MGKMADRMRQKRQAKQAKKKQKQPQSIVSAPQSREIDLLQAAVHAQNAKQIDQAIALYDAVLAENPVNPDAHYNKGLLRYHQQEYVDAFDHLKAAEIYEASFKDYDKITGLTAFYLQDYKTAAERLEKFLRINTDSKLSGILLQCYNNTARFEDVVAYLEARPDSEWTEDYYDCYIDACLVLKQRDKSVQKLEQAVVSDPDSIVLQNMLAKAYTGVKRFDDSFRIYKSLYEKHSDHIKVVLNYALALSENLDYAESEALYNQVLEKDPGNFGAWMNKSYLLRKQMRMNEAVECVAKALEIDPLSPLANYTYGIFNVQNENYEIGYAYHEWSWHTGDTEKFRPRGNVLDWHGESLKGKNLFVYADQGIGDTICHARYVYTILNRYPDINGLYLVVDTKTVEMYEVAFAGIEKVHVKSKSDPMDGLHADYLAAICSLPYVLGERVETVPFDGAYLKPSNVLNYKTNEDDFIIGITWNTISQDAWHKRSVALEALAPIAALPRVRLVNLQYGDTKEARETCGFEVIDDPDIDPWDDLQGHINQIAACDLIVTVDNTTAHAAGALGKPVWTLLPYDTYWRCWHLRQESTPWYPTMRLLRQEESRDYTPVIARVVSDIQRWQAGDDNIIFPPPFERENLQIQDNRQKVLIINDTKTRTNWPSYAYGMALEKLIDEKISSIDTIQGHEVLSSKHPKPTLEQFDHLNVLNAYRYLNPTIFWKIWRADKVIVNGEGVLSGTDEARRLLYLIYMAGEYYNKPVMIVNHSCFPEGTGGLSDAKAVAYYLKAYRVAQTVLTRDPLSAQLLQSLKIPAHYAPLIALDKPDDVRTEKKTIIIAENAVLPFVVTNLYQEIFPDLIKKEYKIKVLGGSFLRDQESAPVVFQQMVHLFGSDNVELAQPDDFNAWQKELYAASLVLSSDYNHVAAAVDYQVPVIPINLGNPALGALFDQSADIEKMKQQLLQWQNGDLSCLQHWPKEAQKQQVEGKTHFYAFLS